MKNLIRHSLRSINRRFGFSIPDVVIATAVTGTFVSAAVIISSQIAETRIDSHVQGNTEAWGNQQQQFMNTGVAADTAVNRLGEGGAMVNDSGSRLHVNSATLWEGENRRHQVGRMSVTSRLLAVNNSQSGMTTKALSHVIGDPMAAEDAVLANARVVNRGDDSLQNYEQPLGEVSDPVLWVFSNSTWARVTPGISLPINLLTDVVWTDGSDAPSLQVRLSNSNGTYASLDLFNDGVDTSSLNRPTYLTLPLDGFGEDFDPESSSARAVPSTVTFQSTGTQQTFTLNLTPITPTIRLALSNTDQLSVRLEDMVDGLGFGTNPDARRLQIELLADNGALPTGLLASNDLNLSSTLGGSAVTDGQFIPSDAFANGGASPAWLASLVSSHPLVTNATAESNLTAIPVSLPDALISPKQDDPLQEPLSVSVAASNPSGWNLPHGVPATVFYTLHATQDDPAATNFVASAGNRYIAPMLIGTGLAGGASTTLYAKTAPAVPALAAFFNPGNPDSASYTMQDNQGDGPGGNCLITVRARGKHGSETIDLRLDGVIVETYTLSTSSQEYTFNGGYDGEEVRIYFTNDRHDPASGVVRDLWLEWVRIGDETKNGADMPVNTSFWNGSSCGGGYSDLMACNGYIDFGTFSCNSTPSTTLADFVRSNLSGQMVMTGTYLEGRNEIKLTTVGRTTANDGNDYYVLRVYNGTSSNETLEAAHASNAAASYFFEAPANTVSYFLIPLEHSGPYDLLLDGSVIDGRHSTHDTDWTDLADTPVCTSCAPVENGVYLVTPVQFTTPPVDPQYMTLYEYVLQNTSGYIEMREGIDGLYGANKTRLNTLNSAFVMVNGQRKGVLRYENSTANAVTFAVRTSAGPNPRYEATFSAPANTMGYWFFDHPGDVNYVFQHSIDGGNWQGTATHNGNGGEWSDGRFVCEFCDLPDSPVVNRVAPMIFTQRPQSPLSFELYVLDGDDTPELVEGSSIRLSAATAPEWEIADSVSALLGFVVVPNNEDAAPADLTPVYSFSSAPETPDGSNSIAHTFPLGFFNASDIVAMLDLFTDNGDGTLSTYLNVQAIASEDSDFANSAVRSIELILEKIQLPDASVTPDSGNLSPETAIELAHNQVTPLIRGLVNEDVFGLRYTTDGTAPERTDSLYSSALTTADLGLSGDFSLRAAAAHLFDPALDSLFLPGNTATGDFTALSPLSLAAWWAPLSGNPFELPADEFTSIAPWTQLRWNLENTDVAINLGAYAGEAPNSDYSVHYTWDESVPDQNDPSFTTTGQGLQNGNLISITPEILAAHATVNEDGTLSLPLRLRALAAQDSDYMDSSVLSHTFVLSPVPIHFAFQRQETDNLSVALADIAFSLGLSPDDSTGNPLDARIRVGGSSYASSSDLPLHFAQDPNLSFTTTIGDQAPVPLQAASTVLPIPHVPFQNTSSASWSMDLVSSHPLFQSTSQSVSLTVQAVQLPNVAISPNGGPIAPDASITINLDSYDPLIEGIDNDTLFGLFFSTDESQPNVESSLYENPVSPADLGVDATFLFKATAAHLLGSEFDNFFAQGNTAEVEFVEDLSNGSARSLVNNVKTLNGNGAITGGIQVNGSANFSLNGNANIDTLIVAGTPQIKLNGNARIDTSLSGDGSASPTNQKITLNGNAFINTYINRTTPVSLPSVPTVIAYSGNRSVTLNNPGTAIDWNDLRDLTINSDFNGTVEMPSGAFRNVTVNGNNTLVLGYPNASNPVAYHFEKLTVNGGAQVVIHGRVAIYHKNAITINGSLNGDGEPDALTLWTRANFTLNGEAAFNGHIVAPSNKITLNHNMSGTVHANELQINGDAGLEGIGGPFFDGTIQEAPVEEEPEQALENLRDFVLTNSSGYISLHPDYGGNWYSESVYDRGNIGISSDNSVYAETEEGYRGMLRYENSTNEEVTFRVYTTDGPEPAVEFIFTAPAQTLGYWLFDRPNDGTNYVFRYEVNGDLVGGTLTHNGLTVSENGSNKFWNEDELAGDTNICEDCEVGENPETFPAAPMSLQVNAIIEGVDGAECEESGGSLIHGYCVTYLGRSYDPESDSTTFSYRATGPGDVGSSVKDLSHFNIALTEELQEAFAYAEPEEAVEMGLDPTTGVDGIKWDFGVAKTDSQDYSITFNGNVSEGTTTVAVKGGPSFSSSDMAGPGAIESSPVPEGEALSCGTFGILANRLTNISNNAQIRGGIRLREKYFPWAAGNSSIDILTVPGRAMFNQWNGMPDNEEEGEGNDRAEWSTGMSTGAHIGLVRHYYDPVDLPETPSPLGPTGSATYSADSADDADPNPSTDYRDFSIVSTAGARYLAPGRYNSVQASNGNHLVLGVPGSTTRYDIQSLNVDSGSSVVLLGPVELYLVNAQFSNSCMVGSAQTRAQIYFSGSGTFTIRNDMIVHADILATNGNAELTNGAQLYGTLQTRNLNVNSWAILSCSERPDSGINPDPYLGLVAGQ